MTRTTTSGGETRRDGAHRAAALLAALPPATAAAVLRDAVAGAVAAAPALIAAEIQAELPRRLADFGLPPALLTDPALAGMIEEWIDRGLAETIRPAAAAHEAVVTAEVGRCRAHVASDGGRA